MSNLRQAAQAALSCVEFFPGQYKNSITSDQRAVFDALRAALAEPHPEPKGWAGWAQIGLLNGNPYLRMVYDRTPYPPPPDVVKNLNLVPVYLGAAPQAQQPGWEHAANEWADATTNAIQHLRNIHEGITTAAEALANMEVCFRHCTDVSDAARKGSA